MYMWAGFPRTLLRPIEAPKFSQQYSVVALPIHLSHSLTCLPLHSLCLHMPVTVPVFHALFEFSKQSLAWSVLSNITIPFSSLSNVLTKQHIAASFMELQSNTHKAPSQSCSWSFCHYA